MNLKKENTTKETIPLTVHSKDHTDDDKLDDVDVPKSPDNDDEVEDSYNKTSSIYTPLTQQLYTVQLLLPPLL